MLGYLRPLCRVDAESALPADEDTLGCFLGSWLVVAEFVSLNMHAHNLALVNVQVFRFWRIEQFVHGLMLLRSLAARNMHVRWGRCVVHP